MKGAAVLTVLFIVSRSLIAGLYPYGFNVFCGDSAYYSFLADNLDRASPDRPSGYPFFLALFPGSLLQAHPTVIAWVQSFLSYLSVLILYAVMLKRGRRQRPALLICSSILLYPFIAFVERSFMPDSLAFSLLISLAAISLIPVIPSSFLPLVGLCLGYLSLLRLNLLIPALFLAAVFVLRIVSNHQRQAKSRAIAGFLLLLPMAGLGIWYNNVFVFNRLHARGHFGFGSRILFANAAQFSTCKDLSAAADFHPGLASAIARHCSADLLSSGGPSILWNPKGFVKPLGRLVPCSKPECDRLLILPTRRLLLRRPLIMAHMLFLGAKKFILTDHQRFYLTNYYPSLGGGCAGFVQKHLGIAPAEILKRGGENKMRSALGLFALTADTVHRALGAVSLCFLAIFVCILLRLALTRQLWLENRYWALLLYGFGAVFYILICQVLVGHSHRHLHSVLPLLLLFALELWTGQLPWTIKGLSKNACFGSRGTIRRNHQSGISTGHQGESFPSLKNPLSSF